MPNCAERFFSPEETLNLFAIDPGVGGGIAYIDTDGSVHALPMPQTDRDICDQLQVLALAGGKPATCYIEELPKFGGVMSRSAMFTMARNYGLLLGILTAYRVRVVQISPKRWQGVLGGLGNKADHGTDWKRRLKARAQELYPALDVTLKTADALLILEVARQLEGRFEKQISR
jgi:hypothetical protein